MISSLFNAIDIASSGIAVQRTRVNTISENIANAQTTRTEDGTPYRRKIPVVQTGDPNMKFSDIFHKNQLKMEQTENSHMEDKPFKELQKCNLTGVHVSEIVEDQSPYKMVYDPHHPDANEEGYVSMPNVNIVQEMTDLISATRTFEANVTTLNSSKDMIRKALKI